MKEEGRALPFIRSLPPQGLVPLPGAVVVGCGGTHRTGRITSSGQWHTVLIRNLNGECLIQIFVKRAVSALGQARSDTAYVRMELSLGLYLTFPHNGVFVNFLQDINKTSCFSCSYFREIFWLPA